MAKFFRFFCILLFFATHLACKNDVRKKESSQVSQQMPVANLPEELFEVRVLMDWSSVEIFINEGQYAMIAQLFPISPYNELQISNIGTSQLTLENFEISKAESIWKAEKR